MDSNRYLSNGATTEPYREWGMLSGYFSNDFYSLDRSKNIALAMNDGTADAAHKQAWVDFDRFYSIDLHTELPSGRHYIFMCRPDLYLVEEGSAASGVLQLSSESRVNVDPYFTYLAKFHPEIIASLTGDFAGIKSNVLTNTTESAASESGYGNSQTTDGTKVISNGKAYQLTIHSFIPYFTSRVESLQLPDYNIKSNMIVQPYTKYSMPYTTSAIESTTGGNFDITFREDRYYSIHKLFYGWLYYQNNVMRNIFSPKKKYVMYNALDYATSIYDFIVDETGENIIYWTKYTGCVPTNVPMSDLSFNRGGEAESKVSISFSYFMCEHMDRNILLDFQYNSLGYIAMNNYFSDRKLNPFPIDQTVPIYNKDTFLGKNFVGRPVIFYGDDSRGNKVFKLRWLG